jgi:hypothetical protein
MAKFLPGPAAAAISGSVGGTTFSTNRFGPYMRRRTIPTNPNTAFQVLARNRLQTVSQAWQALDPDEQEAWRQWAQTNPIVNTLGQPQVLAGHQAFAQINSRLLAMSQALIDTPPAIPAPVPLLTASVASSAGGGTCAITFTATPLGANDRLYIRCAVVSSPGISYVRNRLKLITITSAALASPYDAASSIIARWGTLIEDDVQHFELSVINDATGLLSVPLKASASVAV